MAEDVQVEFRVNPPLRAEAPSTSVDRVQRQGSPANDSISIAERRRRENAVRFAHASVGLEGFKPSHAALVQARKFINGDISLSEFVQMNADEKSTHG